MGYTLQEEFIMDIKEEIKEFQDKHHEEIPIMDKSLDIDYASYQELQDNYMLRCYTLRDVDDLIGYVAYFINTHILFKDELVATQNILYIAKEHRGRGAGKALLEYSENSLKEVGVKTVRQYVPEVNDFSGLLKSIGYNKLETVYVKELHKE